MFLEEQISLLEWFLEDTENSALITEINHISNQLESHYFK